MSVIEQIEKVVQGLSDSELAEFRVWFEAFAQARHDAEATHRVEQIQQSIAQHGRGEGRDGFEAMEELKRAIREQSGA